MLMDNTVKANCFLSISKFTELANKKDTNCISIYIPIDRIGNKVNKPDIKKILKKNLRVVAGKLLTYKLSKIDIEWLLRPAELLLDDIDFCRNQSTGLAIFLSHGEMTYYTLPIHFEKQTHISNHFYLKPLIPFFNFGGNFHLLKQEKQDVRFFKKRQEVLLKYYCQKESAKRTSSNLEEIICAAAEGDVSTLFIEVNKDVYGFYDKENRTVIIDNESTLENICLVNFSAVKSFTQGAEVYFFYSDEMPLKGTVMNAIFRY